MPNLNRLMFHSSLNKKKPLYTICTHCRSTLLHIFRANKKKSGSSGHTVPHVGFLKMQHASS